jgi:hypothetical protein
MSLVFKINVSGAGKPSTYFEGSGTYVSLCGVTRNKKKYYLLSMACKAVVLPTDPPAPSSPPADFLNK